jgi:hypothetical protein
MAPEGKVFMICTEVEYEITRERLEDARLALKARRTELGQNGLDRDEIEQMMSPEEGFLSSLEFELHRYDALRKGKIPEVTDSEDLGKYLIAARISNGWSRDELAKRLDRSPGEVAEFERNEYVGMHEEFLRSVATALGHRSEVERLLDGKGASPVGKATMNGANGLRTKATPRRAATRHKAPQ